jgi:hypothetical protein
MEATILLKYPLNFTGLHGVISQVVEYIMLADVITSHPASNLAFRLLIVSTFKEVEQISPFSKSLWYHIVTSISDWDGVRIGNWIY